MVPCHCQVQKRLKGKVKREGKINWVSAKQKSTSCTQRSWASNQSISNPNLNPVSLRPQYLCERLSLNVHISKRTSFQTHASHLDLFTGLNLNHWHHLLHPRDWMRIEVQRKRKWKICLHFDADIWATLLITLSTKSSLKREGKFTNFLLHIDSDAKAE